MAWDIVIVKCPLDAKAETDVIQVRTWAEVSEHLAGLEVAQWSDIMMLTVVFRPTR